jgi:hypothetical protein
MEFGKEEGTEMDGSRAGDGLESGHLFSHVRGMREKRSGQSAAYSLFADRRAVRSENDFLRGSGEVGKALDWEIFVVDGGIVAKQITSLSGSAQFTSSAQS